MNASCEKTEHEACSANFKNEIQKVRINLGDDYLEIIKKRLGTLKSEVIIAVENQSAKE